jgi:hypothetical protein
VWGILKRQESEEWAQSFEQDREGSGEVDTSR